jgi:endoglucanase
MTVGKNCIYLPNGCSHEVVSDYSQCVPGEAAPGTQTVPSTPTPTTIITPSGTCLPNSPASNTGSTQFKGINIAGFDFGCDTTGTCNESAAWPPLTEFYGADGAGQMTHFVENDGMNVFRLPVGWQFLTGDVATGTLKMENFEKYDKLVQACLATGASCIIDVHNYARFNGKVLLKPFDRYFCSNLTVVLDNRPRGAFERRLCITVGVNRDAVRK